MREHAQRGPGDDGRDKEGRWKLLLDWLATKHGMDTSPHGLRVECRTAKDAGNGLFALDSCPASSTLFTIPAKAMINIKTLSSMYPLPKSGPALSAIQMICLHLLLHRPAGEAPSLDPTFGPFISTMPREFDSHPLTWLIRSEMYPNDSCLKSFIDLLPPSVSTALEKAAARLWSDWHAVRQYIERQKTQRVMSQASRTDIVKSRFVNSDAALSEDFLWAWLNVNTRCIYYVVDPSPSAPCNLTLCPILDFANHAPARTHISPVLPSTLSPPTPGPKRAGAKPGGDYIFRASSEVPIHADDELFLRYGGHSNCRLFVEYGFVNVWTPRQCESGTFAGEVDVQDAVQALFATQGDLGAQARDILEEEGYWGDWTLHSSPAPAHPSYRLMAALRLFHAVGDSAKRASARDEDIEAWKAVIAGQQEAVSDANETTWRATLVSLCEDIAARSRKGIDRVSDFAGLSGRPWLGWAMQNIRLLWQEEMEVATAVAASVRAGVEF